MTTVITKPFESVRRFLGIAIFGSDVEAILKHIAWLVTERTLNRGSEPLLLPKSGIVKIYGPPMCCVVFFNMV